MDKCEFCGAPAIPMQHCLCDEAVALVRELDAKLRARYYPKPATTEPPEWNIGPLPQAMLDLAEMERKARAEVCGITDLMRGVSAPAPSPLDRALEEIKPDYTTPLDLTGLARHIPPSVMCEDWVKMKVERAKLEAEGLLTPVVVADFTARRKAKREEAPDDVWQRFDAYQKEDRRQLDLARALSTPLPHDPDIHTRLMPWRGKE